MNLELMLVSIFLYNKASVADFLFKKEMFRNKEYYNYISSIYESITLGLNQVDANQRFLSKNIIIPFEKEYVETQLNLFSAKTIIEMFYDTAINYIWESRKNKDNKNSKLEDTYALIEEIKSLISQIEKSKEAINPFEQYRVKINEIEEQIINGQFKDGIVGLSSGIYNIDNITGGFKNEYIIIGGRPSMGKTSLALDIAIDNIKSGKSVLVMSIEMTASQIVARSIPKVNDMLSLNNSVNGQDLETKKEALIEASIFLEKSGLEIEDFANNYRVTAIDIQKSLQKYYDKYGFYPDLTILDYIQKIQATGTNKSENDTITETSNMIQRLVKSTGTNFIALSQLNRGLEERNDKRPGNADLRGSGSLEQDADIIMHVFRESVYLLKSMKEKLSKQPDSQDIADAITFLEETKIDSGEIIISKNRNGKTGTAVVQFYKPNASYMQSADFMEENIDF